MALRRKKIEQREYSIIRQAVVHGLGPVFCVTDQEYKPAPLDETLKQYQESDLAIISFRDLAHACVQRGKFSIFCQKESMVQEGVLYLPKQDDKIVLLRETPILKDPEHAIEFHKAGLEFTIGLEDEEEYKNKILAKDESVLVPKSLELPFTKDYGEDEITTWLFKDQAKKFGLLLEDLGVHHMHMLTNDLKYINKQERPYVNQFWYSGIIAKGRFSYISVTHDHLQRPDVRVWAVQPGAKQDFIQK